VFQTYRDSMKKLGLLSDLELFQIFGQIDALVPLHQGISLHLFYLPEIISAIALSSYDKDLLKCFCVC